MNNKAIFIGGIHGVGKTTICSKLLFETGIDHYSASSLIKKLGNNKNKDCDKEVKNVENNQLLLITAIDKYINKNEFYFLDGHFCLLGRNNEVKRIPQKTFEAITPIGVIILYDDIENINSKITKRDGVAYSYDLLTKFQNDEIEYSKEICLNLHIPYLSFNVTNDISPLIAFILKLTDR